MAGHAAFLAGVVHEFVRLGADVGGPGQPPPLPPPPKQGAQPPVEEAGVPQKAGPPARDGGHRAQLVPGPDAKAPAARAAIGGENDSSSVSSTSSTSPPRRVRRRLDLRPKAAPVAVAVAPPPPPPPPMYVANYQGGGWPGPFHPPPPVHAGAWGFPHPPHAWAPMAVHYGGMHQQRHRGHPEWRGLPGNGKGHDKGGKGGGRGGDRGRRGGGARNWIPDAGHDEERRGKPAGKNHKGAKGDRQADRQRDERQRDHHQSVSDSD